MQGGLLEPEAMAGEIARSTSAHLGSAYPPTAAAHRAVARATISCTPKHSCTNRSSEVQRAVCENQRKAGPPHTPESPSQPGTGPGLPPSWEHVRRRGHLAAPQPLDTHQQGSPVQPGSCHTPPLLCSASLPWQKIGGGAAHGQEVQSGQAAGSPPSCCPATIAGLPSLAACAADTWFGEPKSLQPPSPSLKRCTWNLDTDLQLHLGLGRGSSLPDLKRRSVESSWLDPAQTRPTRLAQQQLHGRGPFTRSQSGVVMGHREVTQPSPPARKHPEPLSLKPSCTQHQGQGQGGADCSQCPPDSFSFTPLPTPRPVPLLPLLPLSPRHGPQAALASPPGPPRLPCTSLPQHLEYKGLHGAVPEEGEEGGKQEGEGEVKEEGVEEVKEEGEGEGKGLADLLLLGWGDEGLDDCTMDAAFFLPDLDVCGGGEAPGRRPLPTPADVTFGPGVVEEEKSGGTLSRWAAAAAVAAPATGSVWGGGDSLAEKGVLPVEEVWAQAGWVLQLLTPIDDAVQEAEAGQGADACAPPPALLLAPPLPAKRTRCLAGAGGPAGAEGGPCRHSGDRQPPAGPSLPRPLLSSTGAAAAAAWVAAGGEPPPASPLGLSTPPPSAPPFPHAPNLAKATPPPPTKGPFDPLLVPVDPSCHPAPHEALHCPLLPAFHQRPSSQELAWWQQHLLQQVEAEQAASQAALQRAQQLSSALRALSTWATAAGQPGTRGVGPHPQQQGRGA